MALRPEQPFHIDLVQFGTRYRYRLKIEKSRALVQHEMHVACRGILRADRCSEVVVKVRRGRYSPSL